MTQHAEAKNIDQRISLETFIKINFAANRRHADAVTVVCDAGNNAGKQTTIVSDFGFRISDVGWFFFPVSGFQFPVFRDWSEPEGIEQKLRTRSHRKNVANDSADTRGRPLEGLDCARMIMTFDLERDCPAITDIDYAGVFLAGFDQDIRSGRRKLSQLFS